MVFHTHSLRLQFYNRLADEQQLELGVDDDNIRYNPSDNTLKELKKAHCYDSIKYLYIGLSRQLLSMSEMQKKETIK